MGSNFDHSKQSDDFENLNMDFIERALKETTKGLPDDEKGRIEAFLSRTSVLQSLWYAPMPPPEILKAYNEVIPDAANRILRLLEVKSGHRQKVQEITVLGRLKERYKGQLFALIIALAFLFVSFVLVLEGHDVSGTIIGSVDLVALVSVFAYRRNVVKRQLSAKGKDFFSDISP